jgi:hypothetical protein
MQFNNHQRHFNQIIPFNQLTPYQLPPNKLLNQLLNQLAANKLPPNQLNKVSLE